MTEKRLNLIMDGIIFQMQPRGGISRLYSEILPRMCNLEETFGATLVTTGTSKQPLPTHPRIRQLALFPIDNYLRPGRVWWPVRARLRDLIVSAAPNVQLGDIWHSTYYSLPTDWRRPVVVTVLDMIHERFSELFGGAYNDHFRAVKKRCITTADVVICISESTRQDVLHFYGLDTAKTRVIHLAHTETFRRLESEDCCRIAPVDGPFLLYVGGRGSYKNSATLLNAYSRWTYRKEVSLVFVGPKWTRKEIRCLIDLNIAERIRLIDNADDQTLCHLYNHAAAFIYPSLYEGFGIPVLEAMACGCPIVASRIPSTVEVAGQLAVYFEPTNVEDLLIALDGVLREGRLSAQTESGLRHVKHFSWNDTARKTLDVYHDLSVDSWSRSNMNCL